jgi:hypothetical protein
MLNIKKVIYNEDFTSGCETCDYGSSYVNEIEIILEDETNAKIKVDRMYEYSLSESDYMKLISNSKTIDGFILNIIRFIKEKSYNKNIEFEIDLDDLCIYKNNEKIDILKTLDKNKIVIQKDN